MKPSVIYRNLLCFFILLCCINIAKGQKLYFNAYTTADGLPSNEVYTLHQDKMGYLWVCTNYGILKYNGAAFETVCTNIPFKEQFAYCMYEDARGVMWFANSQANVYEIRHDSAFKIPGIDTISSALRTQVSEIINLVVDDSFNIYLSSKLRSYKLVKAKGYTAINLNNFYHWNGVDFAALEVENAFIPIRLPHSYFGSNEAIKFRFISKAIESATYTLNIQQGSFANLIIRHDSDIFIAADSEVTRISCGTPASYFVSGHHVLSLTFDKQNNAWIGTDQDGLYQVSGTGKIMNHYFSGYSVSNILFDNQNGLWVSTEGQGLMHCSDIHNYSYDDFPGLGHTISMIKNIGSTLFIGTSAGELYYTRNNSFGQINLNPFAKAEVTDILQSGNTYYIATKDALLKINTSFNQLEPIKSTEGKRVTAFGITRQSDGSLYSLTRVSINTIKNNTVVKVCNVPGRANEIADYNGRLVIATDNGLYVLSEDHLTIPTEFKMLEGLQVIKLGKQDNGNLWIGTRGEGLFYMRKEYSIMKYPLLQGKIIHNIFFLNDTTIGLCLNTGIFTSTLSKLNATSYWQELYKGESLTAEMFQNQLYIGTDFGLQSFDLPRITDTVPYKLYLKKIVTGNLAFFSYPFTFNYTGANIEFYFDYLSFGSHSARLAYSLIGGTSESNYLTGTTVIFNKLSPGNYSLLVWPTTNSLSPGNKKLRIDFTIVPAFWQTTLFRIIAITGSILLLYLCMLLLSKQVKNTERKKARITKMLTESRLIALKAQINPHFTANSLSAIQQLILSNETEKAGLYLAKFSLFLRYVLKYSGKSVVSLSEELKLINLYIELEQLRFNRGFEFLLVMDPAINPDEIFIPSLITQPFIENAIWHGLIPLEGKKQPKLIFRVEQTDSFVEITIEDNGVGRSRSEYSSESYYNEPHGLQLINNRINTINLHFGMKAIGLKIEDITDTYGSPTGTKVSLILTNKLTEVENEKDDIYTG